MTKDGSAKQPNSLTTTPTKFLPGSLDPLLPLQFIHFHKELMGSVVNLALVTVFLRHHRRTNLSFKLESLVEASSNLIILCSSKMANFLRSYLELPLLCLVDLVSRFLLVKPVQDLINGLVTDNDNIL